MSTEVYLELGARKTFACAIEWPGWSRSGKTTTQALEALAAYGPRYAAALRRSRLAFTPPAGVEDLVVRSRLKGNATTDFGAPGKTPPADKRPVDEAELERLRTILEASWKAFDAAVRAGRGKELRLGPRGGGRSLDKIIDHVAGAEEGYLRQLGSRPVGAAAGPWPNAAREARRRVLDALAARARGEPAAESTSVKHPWTPRFFVRRASWHLLDHAWEIEDRIIAGMA